MGGFICADQKRGRQQGLLGISEGIGREVGIPTGGRGFVKELCN